MRILSWNINGVRTIPQYHPWNAFKTWDGVLRELGGDIICFQGSCAPEMKTTRAAIGRNFAVPDSFDSFFSFPANKGGYSGVAVYADVNTAVPLKAEEGLSGKLQPKPPLVPQERVSASYPHAHEMDLMEDADGNTLHDLQALDSEGRALVVDFGLFVLINLYCPNETSDARLPFKMNYHFMLQERVRKLIEEKREVIVVGDINVCAAPIDHCDGHLPSNASTFWEHPARAWFHRWIGPDGPLIDVLRKFWPDRKGMYTCWNTKISARDTNYGTRIDYFLVTPGLLPWISHGDIQPSVKGSDHCPIYIDLHDEITLDGEKRTLREAMKMDGSKREAPRLAAKYWNEFTGKQMLMSNFFGKRAASDSKSASEIPASKPVQPSLSTAFDALASSSGLGAPCSVPSPSEQVSVREPKVESPSPSHIPRVAGPYSNLAVDNGTPSSRTKSIPRPSQEQRKRQRSDAASSSSKTKKLKSGQAKLSSFFTKSSTSQPSDVIEVSDSEPALAGTSSRAPSSSPPLYPTETQEQLDADFRLAQELSFSQESTSPSQSESVLSQSKDPTQSKKAWSTLFAPVPPPKCAVHGEPAKEFRVNKPGPNKGKVFYVCSRPVGPGYDKGRSERLREEVDPQYKCDFFKWASEVKREALRAHGEKGT
ncbi:DNase I-like protein [Auriscalpium vulgare]|uniref:DNase I-like protein n=1 Tax=Auriscalpium vulgare TaxID=40419 RepID=A0ACB8RR79_9AGAM|nr:DNase I-like protein [Auriscalpium vulgare]